MDTKTLAAYDSGASGFAEDWLAQPVPTDLYALLEHYFEPGKTADIGCGAGRDTAWLASKDFDVVGYDGSPGLLGEAQRRYPEIHFEHSLLPTLEGVERAVFQNVLCETVIMHLPPEQVSQAILQMLALLVPGGVLALSWRTSAQNYRDPFGRLYASIDDQLIAELVAGHQVLLDTENINLSSQKTIRRLVVRAHS
ncbi:MAG: Methyltransferase [Pseudomonas sp.]|jgi:trans-aconitate methyltransferase|uniref:class I SAM-dependent methyltransferase n=1 Tax=Pseudomonas sp. TaxID=306 RepID=UPI0026312EEA|nr:class I SAM-dependent methyltransferase [Pseudomonas sp.]MDB6050222.1 Methyltransferase [Pseudomonas sp.]